MNLGNEFRWKYNAAIIDQMFCYIVLVYCIGLLYWSIVRVFCRDLCTGLQCVHRQDGLHVPLPSLIRQDAELIEEQLEQDFIRRAFSEVSQL